jgi:tetratricopeptide (TPR) repeat protein
MKHAMRTIVEQMVDSLRQAEEQAHLYPTLGEHEKEAVCLFEAGVLSRQLGEHQKALEYLTRVLAICRDRYLPLRAKTLLRISWVHSALGEEQKAQEYEGRAKALFRAIKQDWPAEVDTAISSAKAAPELARGLSSPDILDAAREHLEHALDLSRKSGIGEGKTLRSPPSAMCTLK